MVCPGLDCGKTNSWPIPSTAPETGGVRHRDLRLDEQLFNEILAKTEYCIVRGDMPWNPNCIW